MQYGMLSLAFIIYKKIAPNELTLGAITLLYLISYSAKGDLLLRL